MILFSIHHFIRRTHQSEVMLDSSDEESDDSLFNAIFNCRNVCPRIALLVNNAATTSNGSSTAASNGSTVTASNGRSAATAAAFNGRRSAASASERIGAHNGRSAGVNVNAT